jgi:hypothetical protein
MRRLEAVVNRLLHVVVERQLQTLALGRWYFFEGADLSPKAVYNHDPRAVLAHQERVVSLFNPGLTNQIAALQRIVRRHHCVVDFTDIPEQMRCNPFRGVLPRRYLFDDDVR